MADKTDPVYWLYHLGEAACSYYDGPIGRIADVRVGAGGLFGITIMADGHWYDAAWCSLDTHEDRWLQPDVAAELRKKTGIP